jgi:catechol 2,3-dioxygenase
MIRLTRIGHVLLRVADATRAKAFYCDVLGFKVAEEEPQHGGVFMTLGDDFHTLDVFAHPAPESAPRPRRDQIGLGHIAFQVGSYAALAEAYTTLQAHGVEIEHAADHVNQRSSYFSDPDGNRLEIYYEMPGALARFAGGRGDLDQALPFSRPGEPPPAWLSERWPPDA